MEERLLQETIPVWKRYVLTIAEAADYYKKKKKKLRQVVDDNIRSDFVIMNGNRVLIKRRQFEEFLDNSSCV